MQIPQYVGLLQPLKDKAASDFQKGKLFSSTEHLTIFTDLGSQRFSDVLINVIAKLSNINNF
jgi:hypothetical protein